MLTRVRHLPVLLLACAVLSAATSAAQAQTSLPELQKILREKVAFDETDFAALQRGETIVTLAPVQDKREIAVSGLVNLRANADEFLRSYRDSLTRKSNAAVLEVGMFSSSPSVADLEKLTLEAKDVEDLKNCVVGNCELKLSAAMIERFGRDVNWQAADYARQATQLYKTMLLEYVNDYRSRGDAALIAYNDKQNEIRVAEEHEAIRRVSGYLSDLASTAGSSTELQPLEQLLVWSKIKFGLKPVVAINHVTIYKRDRELGPQVLFVSKQIYANHYFNSSLALTGFVTVAGPTSYIVYENRSRADGLSGPFSKFKRGVVEKKALEGLRGILHNSKLTFEGPALARDLTASTNPPGGWKHRLFGGIRPLLWFLIISGLIALLALRNYEGKAGRAAGVKEINP
ncbi:MAG: hypothetical protein LC794_09000 [Acidobacteria bacterium]|nr:hypothetical protein [Acidobacteriota bacterium]